MCGKVSLQFDVETLYSEEAQMSQGRYCSFRSIEAWCSRAMLLSRRGRCGVDLDFKHRTSHKKNMWELHTMVTDYGSHFEIWTRSTNDRDDA